MAIKMYRVLKVMYVCAEQYMMASKAALFQDQLALDRIMSTDDPSEHQNLGRQVANFDPAAWDRLKTQFVLVGNYQKFRQNPAMRDELLATGNKVRTGVNGRVCWRERKGCAKQKVHPVVRRTLSNYPFLGLL